MTTEEKAKAYDEALERAKFYHGNCPSEPERKKLERMFPVLRESEDERIRKFLIDLLSCGIWKEEWPFTPPECVEYLEKQKEQKPADDKAFEEWIDDWWKHNKVNNPDSYDKGDEIQFDEQGFKNFCHRIRNMYQQKQEWSEEDKRKLNRIYEILGHAADDKGFLVSKRIIGDHEAVELQDFLESLLSRLYWKPSKEQMDILDKIYHYLWADIHATAEMQDGLGDLIDELKELIEE